jgi:primosomal protein N' (replication factor Y)
MKMVTVIPLKKGIFKDTLTYFSTKEIPSGHMVEVSVRSKKVLGLVISSEEVAHLKSKIKGMDFNLKKITEAKGKSLFREEFLASAMLASKYFAGGRGSIITALIPSAFREEYDKIAKIKNETSENEKRSPASKIKPEKLLFQTSFSDRISFYKTLIRESFAQKKSLFIVLPTERDIEILEESLLKGIEHFIITLSGGMSAKKQLEGFQKIITSIHPVLILATAPYLSIPRYDIETIILENESSNSYRTIGRNHLDWRIFTEIFAVKIGAKLILADTLLRFETLALKNKGDWGELRPLSFRLNLENCEIKILGKSTPPEASEEKKGKFRILSEASLREIKSTLALGKNIFIFSLRKGLATLTVCRDCAEPLLCEKCLAPVVLYLSRNGQKRMFVCNRCGHEKSPETTCPNCGSWNLLPLGIGTDTVSEELKNLFPENIILKLDKESAGTARQAKKIVSDFEKEKGAILVGTEMALFYLKAKVPLSIIASFDSLWSIPSFKMSERVIQLLISILGQTEEKLIIETKNENDPAILAVANESLLSFFRSELEDRKNLGYPPFRRFIKITYQGDKESTVKAKKMLAEFLHDYTPEIFSGFVAKFKNKYITNALMKLAPGKWSLPELSADGEIDQNLLEKLLSLEPTFSLSVDPEDLL